MVNREDLKKDKYEDYRLRNKINQILFGPYLRDTDKLDEYEEMNKLIKNDYNDIQSKIS